MLKSLEIFGFKSFADRTRFDFAFNLINTIRHLASDQAMLSHLDQVARVLKPDGLYAVGVSLSSYGRERPDGDRWVGCRGACRVEQTVRCEPPRTPGQWRRRIERVRSLLTVTRPGGVTKMESTYCLRCYDLLQWLGLLKRSALRLDATVDGFGDPAPLVEPGYAIHVLRPR